MNCCANVDPEKEEDQGEQRNEEKGGGESSRTSWETVQGILVGVDCFLFCF